MDYVCEKCNFHYYTEGLQFVLDGESYTVSYPIYGGKEIVIPAIYLGLPVTKIADNGFSDSSTLTTIIIPETITSIGDYAFSNCSDLTDVKIPNSVKNIGSNAFYGCVGITEIVIPDSVISIDTAAFIWCTRLEKVTIGKNVESIGDEAFYACSSIFEINYNGTEQQCNNIIIGCSNEFIVNTNKNFLVEGSDSNN